LEFILDQTKLYIEESDAIVSGITSYPTGESPTEVQWRTLICNVTPDMEKAPKEYEKIYEAWRRCNRVERSTDLTADFLQQRPFTIIFSSCNNDKIFGVTGNSYLGMFPKSAVAGDEIWVLFGGDFPFVLRKMQRARYYQLVGQCYIHGIMEGQLGLKQDDGQMIYLA
jgi:hypothetical protein